MKFSNIKYIAAAAFAAVAASAMAQETYSGYFVEGYEYRYRMNPAFGNDAVKAQNFVSMPALGNLNVAMRGNQHLTSIFYNVGGKTVLFTNPEVPASKVMKNLADENKLGVDLNMVLLAGGFNAWGGYNTITISARGGVNAVLPKDMYRLLKEGVSNRTYTINNVGATAQAFGEIALGHSRDINSQWRVGGALKFYLGVADVDARLQKAQLALGTDNWTIRTRADIYASGIGFKSKYFEKEGYTGIDGINTEGMGVSGFGMGLDLGGVFTLDQDWQFSAAVLDLGFISWSKNEKASTNGTKEFETDKYTFSVDDDSEHSFKNEWDRVSEDLEKLYRLEYDGKAGSRTTMPGVTLNFAARYTLPVYRPLTFGLVNTSRIQGNYSWTDFRLSANVAPVKCFSASANLAVGSYGVGFGWMLNYHYTGFGLFLGMDNTLGRLAKQGIPLNSNASLNFGMNFLF